MSKTPAIIPHLFPNFTWKGAKGMDHPHVYLTFDDGPVPEITPWVLMILKEYHARATFFCLGKNVETNPEIFQKIIEGGHTVGNHTFSHVSGFNTKAEDYISEVEKASRLIPSKLFRPPYGRITRRQANRLSPEYQLVMWDIMSGDFDHRTTQEKCIKNVLKHISDGSIVVFHDSIKAAPLLKECLPKILKALSSLGYQFVPLKAQTKR